MKMVIHDKDGRHELTNLSYYQGRQAYAITSCIGRLIPQEGIDYDVEIIFKGSNDPSVSLNIDAHTDKGEWWKKYVMSMINKYPPTVDDPPQSLDETIRPEDVEQEVENAQVVP